MHSILYKYKNDLTTSSSVFHRTMEGGATPSPLDVKLAVVTGANKGIGLEICRQLASNGVRVILTARDETRGVRAVEMLKEEFGLSHVIFHQLDVTDGSSIASLAYFIKTHFGKLDILVNNAAVGGLTVDFEIFMASMPKNNEKVEDANDLPDWMKNSVHQTYKEAEECLKTNYNGVKDITKALIPLLLSSNAGKIVNISSTLGKLEVISNERMRRELCDVDGLTESRLTEILDCFLKDFKEELLEIHGWPTIPSAYKVSKVLLNAYTRILAKEYPTLCINCVNPGFVKTDLNWNSGILTVEEGAKGPVMLALMSMGSHSGLFFDQINVSCF